jgi:NAD kinase
MRIKYLYNEKDLRVTTFTHFIQQNYPTFLTQQDPQLYLIAGGDGAMLHAINKTLKNGIPYIGKGMGTLNFLMNEFIDDKKIIDGLINDTIKYDVLNTYGINASLNGVEIGEAVNDIVIGEMITDYFKFNISTKQEDLTNFEVKGSGLCISTSIGSTALNFNNGGRIVPLDSKLLSITGIACNRYLNDILSIQDILITSNGPTIYLDNVKTVTMKEGDVLKLSKGSTFKLAFLNKKEFLKKRIEFSHRFRK